MRRFALLLGSCAFLLACPKEKSEPSAPAKPIAVDAGSGAPLPSEAKVDFAGTFVRGKVKAKRYLVFVSREPCAALGPEATQLGATEHPESSPDAFFLQIYTPQGSVGHVCGLAIDEEGRLVGAAAHSGNPLTFSGAGALEFKGIQLTLEPVKPPRPAPKSLVP